MCNVSSCMFGNSITISSCKLFHFIVSLHCNKIEFLLQKETNCERDIQDIHLFRSMYALYVFLKIEAHQNVTPGHKFWKKFHIRSERESQKWTHVTVRILVDLYTSVPTFDQTRCRRLWSRNVQQIIVFMTKYTPQKYERCFYIVLRT